MDIDSVLKGHGIGVGGSNIKRIQRGSIAPFNDTSTTTYSVPIESIDISKSIVRIFYYPNSDYDSIIEVKCSIESSTSIKLQRYSAGASLGATIYWEVIEFNNVKSKQSGFVSGSTTTVNISAVDTSKSLLFVSAYCTTNNIAGRHYLHTIRFNSSTQLGITASPEVYLEWQLIEFN